MRLGGTRPLLLAAVALPFLLGCFEDVETPFPPGLEPLEEENLAGFPEPEDDEPYPERMLLARSFATDSPRTPAVHARGYVHAPIAVVWEAMRNPDIGADRRVMTEWSTTYDVEEGYDYSYAIHGVINNVIIVEYDVTWRHAFVEGTLETPTIVAVRFQKTAGSSVINDLRASVVLRAVEDSVTSIEVIEYLNAIMSSHANIESFLNDFFRGLVIVSHGEPLPPIGDLPPVNEP